MTKLIAYVAIYFLSVLTSFILLKNSSSISASAPAALSIPQPQNLLKVSARLCGEYAQLSVCENKKWGKGLGACILDNHDGLKPYCDITVMSYTQAFEKCQSSVLCPGKSKGQIATCLFEKLDKLSADCKKNFLSVTTDQD